MKPTRRTIARWLFTAIAVMSLVLFTAVATFWARTCLGTFDEIEWVRAGGRMVSIRTTNADFVVNLDEVPFFPAGHEWRVNSYPGVLGELHTICDLQFYRSSRGSLCATLTVPWWWLALAVIAVPAIWIRSALRSRRRMSHGSDRFCWLAGGLVAVGVVIMNISPRAQAMGPSYWGSSDETHWGWPFVARASAPIDDGSTWRHWAMGAVVANIFATMIFALTAGALTWLAIAPIRRMVHNRRVRAGFCAMCNYNLTGNTSGICPECGSPTPAKQA